MSKKRRVFDIELPDDLEPVEAPAAEPVPARRGPMASAVRENAEALSSRAELEAQIRAENDRLAHEHVRLKKAGLITDLVPTEAISTGKLIRDRNFDGTDELSELKDSLKAIGLSNPIQVEQVGEGHYELVQGLRRLTAWRELRLETGDDERWGAIPATVLSPGETLETLYRRMVDENLVRKDVSFGEMAMLAREYAADPETPAVDIEAAISDLYGSAGKQKRSYIKSFVQLLELIGDHVRYPQGLRRQLGLDLRKVFTTNPNLIDDLAARLGDLPEPRQPEDERAILLEFGNLTVKSTPVGPKPGKPRPARTTFRLERPGGAAKVTASHGRLEVRLETDFSAKDRRRLEEALEAFLAQLDE